MNFNERPLILIPLIMLLFSACKTSPGGPAAEDASGKTFRGAEALMNANPEIRFAVLDFTDASGSFAAYGKIVGDETFYRLSSLKGIHLLERGKLDALLEEHRLEQSGLVSGGERERLGALLAVDVLVMGSYVFEGDRIKVNGRYTEVKTGEIKGTFVYYLGVPGETAEGGDISTGEPESCEPYEKAIEPYMRDLRTPAMVETAVRAAVKIPFTVKCRRIHQDIMGTLARGGLYPEEYRRFLRDTVIAIRDPEEVERKTAVFYYFQSDKKIDEMEWNTGVLSIRIANERTARRVVHFMLNRGEPQDWTVLRRRIDILMELAGAGAVGKPVPLSPEAMFQAVISTGAPRDTTRDMRLYLLDKYAPRLVKNTKLLSHILSFSEKSLVPEKDRAARAKFYAHIGGLFPAADVDVMDDLAIQMIRFIGEMHYRFGKEDAAELRALCLALAPWFCRTVTQTRSDYRLKAAAGILDKYNIQCGSGR